MALSTPVEREKSTTSVIGGLGWLHCSIKDFDRADGLGQPYCGKTCFKRERTLCQLFAGCFSL